RRRSLDRWLPRAHPQERRGKHGEDHGLSGVIRPWMNRPEAQRRDKDQKDQPPDHRTVGQINQLGAHAVANLMGADRDRSPAKPRRARLVAVARALGTVGRWRSALERCFLGFYFIETLVVALVGLRIIVRVIRLVQPHLVEYDAQDLGVRVLETTKRRCDLMAGRVSPRRNQHHPVNYLSKVQRVAHQHHRRRIDDDVVIFFRKFPQQFLHPWRTEQLTWVRRNLPATQKKEIFDRGWLHQLRSACPGERLAETRPVFQTKQTMASRAPHISVDYQD